MADDLLRLIQETIDLGAEPRKAAKWWLYIAAQLKKRREHHGIPANDHRGQAGDA